VFAHATYFPDTSIAVVHADDATLTGTLVDALASTYGGGGAAGHFTLAASGGARPTWDATGGAGGRPRILTDGAATYLVSGNITKGSTWSENDIGLVGCVPTSGSAGGRVIVYGTLFYLNESNAPTLLRSTVSGGNLLNSTTTEDNVGLWSQDCDVASFQNTRFNGIQQGTAALSTTAKADSQPIAVGATPAGANFATVDMRAAYISETVLTTVQRQHLVAFLEYHTGVLMVGDALLDFSVDGTFTRASEAAAVDPRESWDFYDLITPYVASDVRRVLADGTLLMEETRTNIWQNTDDPESVVGILGSLTTATPGLADLLGGTAGMTVDFQGATNGANEAINATPDIAGDVRAVLSCYAKNSLDLRFLYRNAANTVLRTGDVSVGAAWARVEAMVTDYDNRMGFNADAAQTVGERHIFLPQAEVGYGSTSPIRTSGSAATRPQERLVVASANVPYAFRAGHWYIDVWPVLSQADMIAEGVTNHYILHGIPSNEWILSFRQIGGGYGIGIFSAGAWVNLIVSGTDDPWAANERVRIIVDMVNLEAEVDIDSQGPQGVVAFNEAATDVTDVHIGTTSTGASPFTGAIGPIIEIP
jgi:hypothetical protein